MATTERHDPRVLLVDDDVAVAKALSTVLRRAGYDVTVAFSAAEAEILILERFDAMVLDLRMPETRGDAFYYLACNKQPWLTGRALFVTGDITEQAERLIEPTGCHMLLKPFRTDVLLEEMLLIAPIRPRLVERAG
ncbi:MAG TPA: response regulator [Gemmatimonadaceae bacterium]|nr:response regulator [Gemmatimonadaceae bacterium]